MLGNCFSGESRKSYFVQHSSVCVFIHMEKKREREFMCVCGSENRQSLLIRITSLIGLLLGSSWVCLCICNVLKTLFLLQWVANSLRWGKKKRATSGVCSVILNFFLFFVVLVCVWATGLSAIFKKRKKKRAFVSASFLELFVVSAVTDFNLALWSFLCQAVREKKIWDQCCSSSRISV